MYKYQFLLTVNWLPSPPIHGYVILLLFTPAAVAELVRQKRDISLKFPGFGPVTIHFIAVWPSFIIHYTYNTYSIFNIWYKLTLYTYYYYTYITNCYSRILYITCDEVYYNNKLDTIVCIYIYIYMYMCVCMYIYTYINSYIFSQKL